MAHADFDVRSVWDAILESCVIMQYHDRQLKIYEAGPATVIGFGGTKVLQFEDLDGMLSNLEELVALYSCRCLTVDLTGVTYVPSGFLGVLAQLRQKGLVVEIRNPGRNIREVLSITHLDRILRIHELAV